MVNKKELLTFINKRLNGFWTDAQLSDGKEIDLLPAEARAATDFSIVFEYKKAGWDVFHYVNGTREYLWFRNPNYKGAKNVN